MFLYFEIGRGLETPTAFLLAEMLPAKLSANA